MIPRKPLAPPPLSAAMRQISSRALPVNRISTPEYPKSDWYCDIREPFTSVRILRRSGTVRGESVVIEGRREINSGIKLSQKLDEKNKVCWFRQMQITRIWQDLKRDRQVRNMFAEVYKRLTGCFNKIKDVGSRFPIWGKERHRGTFFWGWQSCSKANRLVLHLSII